MRYLLIEIGHDSDCESPLVDDNWELVTFGRGRRITDTKEPHRYIKGLDRDGVAIPANIGIKRKLQAGTAFIISYYEHGNCQYSLLGEGPQCMWDSVRIAGMLLWNGDSFEIGASYEDRQSSARAALESYSQWANGECYYYTITDSGSIVDSCGGFIGMDSVRDAVREYIRPDDDLSFGGDCASYIDTSTFKRQEVAVNA